MILQELFTHYKLGTIIEEPKEIDGGLLHTVYSVKTESNHYVIKRLNPEIMKREGVLHHISESEKIGQSFRDLVPVVPAINMDNSPVFNYKDDYYILFNWVNGVSVFPPNITSQQCVVMGEILGIMHTSTHEVSNLSKETLETQMYEWDYYLSLGKENSSKWVSTYEQSISDLKSWNKQLVEVSVELGNHLVISHRDLDPKNVMWHNNRPYLIDWEAAGYVNPYQELLEMLTYWADDNNGSLDKIKFMSMYDAYKEYDTCVDIEWSKIALSGYGGMLGWLNYSFKRSLGLEAENDDERTLGTEQVFTTIKALNNYDKNVEKMLGWLQN